jgi:Flp pilus assembly protein protease CpaA
MIIIQIVIALISLTIFIAGGICDWKYRRVPNAFWIPIYFIGIINILLNPVFLVVIILLVIACYISYRLSRFGGADFKGIIGLSMVYPLFIIPIIFIACISGIIMYPITGKKIPFISHMAIALIIVMITYGMNFIFYQ